MKLTKPFAFIFNSVFSKLLTILILTGLLINIAVLIFFKFGFTDTYKIPFRQNITEHIYYLVEDMGSPPDRQLAEYVFLKSGFDVFYKSKNQTWTTAEGDISYDDIRKKIDDKCFRNRHFKKHISDGKKNSNEKNKRKKNLISFLEKRLLTVVDKTEIEKVKQRLRKIKNAPGLKVGLVNRHLTVLYENENEGIIFYKSKIFHDKAAEASLILLAFLTLIIVFAYLLIRKILKPIKSLSGGVENVSQGNLSFQISSHGKDELGRLTGAFNDMTGKIKKMLHAKEELLIDISHELRSPVTRAKVAMEFLPDSDIKKSIHEDISEIEVMINELLESARLTTEHGRPEKQKTNIRSLINDVIKMNQSFNHQILMADIQKDDAILVDPDQIKTSLKNIIENAIKYSNTETGRIKISVKQTQNITTIKIKDNGTGIPEEELPYIFEPFYRVDKSRSKKTGGYGLGLNLCKNIMEAHGGTIEAKSTEGKGTSILLHFPSNLRD